MADDIQNEQEHEDRSESARGRTHRRHGAQARRGRQHHQGAEHERQRGTEQRAAVGRDERPPDTHFLRQVARIVRGVAGIGNLPDHGQGHRAEPTCKSDAAAHGKIRRQPATHHHEANQQRRTHDPGTDPVEKMDKVIANHTDAGGADARNDGTAGQRHGRKDGADRLARQEDVGGKENDVDHGRKPDHQQRTVAPELASALHHLRHTEQRPLRRTQRQHNRAQRMTDDHRGDGREQRQAIDLHRKRSGDDRQRRNARAEPQRKKIGNAPMPLRRWHEIDATRLGRRACTPLRRACTLLRHGFAGAFQTPSSLNTSCATRMPSSAAGNPQ